MKYVEVYQAIKSDIVTGVSPAWSQLEGEHALADKFEVSRPTLRKAIEKLKQESFVHSRQGSGMFVNPPEFYQDNNLTSISERINNDVELKNIVLEFNKIRSNQTLADKFRLNAGVELFHFKRMRIINGEPAILEETWMPVNLFPEFTEAHCEHSVLNFIEHNSGQNISHDAKTISGKALNDKEAFLLRVEPQHICLSIHHHVYLLHSVLAQYTIETLASNELTTVSIR
ncbi:GntR family transcriptional regulator [Vibrio sp. 10N.286.49.C2]|uniref:GntR family transcriptional regulator n=1 Tax=unclassified Vibrio TaxID=2614977 RepID=UPI000C84FBD6|nr:MULTISPECIES: GntR family transcriptional regulator [unclassified Vibrio]PMH26443.1 GntR family transcriptional regulator [Vibrio sp. 10N.286.49.C2]PMH54833.1 GntR family transcriptional regulator [Vibrio sp. 10N.286.49.B1]PMH82089.1 GntR family transcriptional regulator [Vibrio sp. 10N.286.48.B7]